MSIKKILALALSLSLALFACGFSGAASSEPASAAVDDPNLRIILPRNVNYTTEKAFIGSLERVAGYDAKLDFPKTISVTMPRDGLFVKMSTKSNEWILKGDPIATFSVIANDLEIDEAALALELAETAFRREIENHEAEVAAARDRYDAEIALALAMADAGRGGPRRVKLADAQDAEAAVDTETDIEAAEAEADANAAVEAETDANAADEADTEADEAETEADAPATDTGTWAKAIAASIRLAELSLQAAEENLDFALYNGERNLNFMRAHLEELRKQSEDFTVYAPITGYLYDLVYFTEGRSAYRWQYLCRISSPEAFQLVVSASNLTQLRLGAPVTIETSRRDGPTFAGHVTGNSTLLGKFETEGRAVIALDNPQEVLDYSGNSALKLTGLRYRANISQSDIRNVLLAPRRAINTEAAYRFVNILEDGLSKKRYVLVGLSNMDYVQILDGIKDGDELITN